MGKSTKIDLQALVDTHERPFVVIDHQFKILAVNRAYERAYGTQRDQILGRRCYEVSHHQDRPCYETGSECPYPALFEQQEATSSLHIHHDAQGQIHRVQIQAYPITDSEGELFLGEAIEDVLVSKEAGREEVRMVGASPVYRHMVEQLELAARTDAPVLLEGETGTGKDLAASYIHQHSPRAGKPLLTLDCTVLSEQLFEAELFGHERGAFTGSVGEKEGLLEVVDGGTLFLDEVGELPASLQAKLLRVLETGEFRRVGGRKTLHMKARVICATNRNLGQDVDARLFREDLYYRVACLHIRVPRLRERLQDIPLLAEALLDRISLSLGQRVELSPDGQAELQGHHYPGNIRELRNLLNVAVAHSSNGKIGRTQIAAVSERMRSRRDHSVVVEEPAAPSHAETKPSAEIPSLRNLESKHISQLLKRHGGNRRQVAKVLGVSERTIYRKLRRYGLT